MSNISGTGGNKPKDPYENYRVEKIEAERFDPKRSSAPSSKKQREKTFFQNAFFLFFTKMFRSLFPPKKPSVDLLMESKIENLQKLLACFQKMKREETYEDSSLLQNFSFLWRQFLEDVPYFKKFPILYEKLTSFIEQVHLFPKEEEHPLGYYLSEYTGEKWLPFPFIALLQKLHQEYVKNPEGSHLENWSSQVRDFLSFFSTLKQQETP